MRICYLHILSFSDSCEGKSGDEDFTEDAGMYSVLYATKVRSTVLSAADEDGVTSKAIDSHEKSK